jgi:hypothetical protein
MTGCFKSFYKVETAPTVNSEVIEDFQKKHKIIIGHFTDAIVSLENIKSVEDKIEAEVHSLQENDLELYYSSSNKSKSYKPKKEADLLMQVHLYINKNRQNFSSDIAEKVIIPVSEITRIDIYEKDKKRTTTNHVFSALGIALIVISIATAIAAGAAAGAAATTTANACNCPQVYIQDSNQSFFKSGLYSGAINSNLERSDYLLLDNFPSLSDSLKIRIENVHGEQQYINRLQLLKVSHPPGTKVLMDRNGKIYSYTAPVSPMAVIDNGGKDYSKQVRYVDSENAGFIQPGKDGEASSLVLQFPANMAGKKARLILRANNTLWSGFIYKEFQGLYGNAYTSIRDSQEKMDPSVSQNWVLNQSLPLKVYVENVKGDWQMADYFQMPGNTAKRDMVMEIDIPNTPFQTVRIKLETVFRFWELDYAALDNTEQAGLESMWVSPSKALVSTGENALDKISATDKEYLSLTGHAYLDLQYNNLSGKNDTETYFLCGTGYYHQSPVNSKSPDIAALNKFKNPGYFQVFSLQEYEKVSTELTKNMYAGKNSRTRK